MMTTSLLFPVRPATTARRIAVHPVLWPALTLVCLTASITLVLRWPATVDAVVQHLPLSATSEDRSAVQAALTDDLALRCATIPVLVTVRLAVFSLLIYVLGRIPSPARSPRFRDIMVLCTHAEVLLAIGILVAQLAGWNPPMEGRGIPGVLWIVRTDGNSISAALLRSCNVLTLWYVASLAVGLRVLFGGSSLRSLLVAFAAWSVSILANLWLIRLMHDALHLRV